MKKAVIFDFANIGISDLINELRNRGLDCIGFDKTTQFLVGDLRNKRHIKSFGMVVFIGESQRPSRVVLEYMRVLGNKVPMVYFTRNDDIVDSIFSCLNGYCAEWSLTDEYKRICDEVRKNIDTQNIVCDVSGNLSSAVAAIIIKETCGDKVRKYIYRTDDTSDGGIAKLIIPLWEKCYGLKVEPFIVKDIFNPLPKFESNEQMSKYLEENSIAVKNLFEELTDCKKAITGYVTGTENEFDGMHPKSLKTIYTSLEHPGYKIPIVQPTKNLFGGNVAELAQHLKMPSSLINAYKEVVLK